MSKSPNKEDTEKTEESDEPRPCTTENVCPETTETDEPRPCASGIVYYPSSDDEDTRPPTDWIQQSHLKRTSQESRKSTSEVSRCPSSQEVGPPSSTSGLSHIFSSEDEEPRLSTPDMSYSPSNRRSQECRQTTSELSYYPSSQEVEHRSSTSGMSNIFSSGDEEKIPPTTGIWYSPPKEGTAESLQSEPEMSKTSPTEAERLPPTSGIPQTSPTGAEHLPPTSGIPQTSPTRAEPRPSTSGMSHSPITAEGVPRPSTPWANYPPLERALESNPSVSYSPLKRALESRPLSSRMSYPPSKKRMKETRLLMSDLLNTSLLGTEPRPSTSGMSTSSSADPPPSMPRIWNIPTFTPKLFTQKSEDDDYEDEPRPSSSWMPDPPPRRRLKETRKSAPEMLCSALRRALEAPPTTFRIPYNYLTGSEPRPSTSGMPLTSSSGTEPRPSTSGMPQTSPTGAGHLPPTSGMPHTSPTGAGHIPPTSGMQHYHSSSNIEESSPSQPGKINVSEDEIGAEKKQPPPATPPHPVLTCYHCDYTTDNKRVLSEHIQYKHPEMLITIDQLYTVYPPIKPPKHSRGVKSKTNSKRPADS